MERNYTTNMSQPDQESDDLEEYRERAREIIQREKSILDRLA
jgi:hypothetical protein